MPVKSMDNLKATSPSTNVQRGVDQAWGQQNQGNTPQQALANKWTKKPVTPGKK